MSVTHLWYRCLPQVCSVSAATEVSYYLTEWATPEGLTANPFKICPHRKNRDIGSSRDTVGAAQTFIIILTGTVRTPSLPTINGPTSPASSTLGFKCQTVTAIC